MKLYKAACWSSAAGQPPEQTKACKESGRFHLVADSPPLVHVLHTSTDVQAQKFPLGKAVFAVVYLKRVSATACPCQSGERVLWVRKVS